MICSTFVNFRHVWILRYVGGRSEKCYPALRISSDRCEVPHRYGSSAFALCGFGRVVPFHGGPCSFQLAPMVLVQSGTGKRRQLILRARCRPTSDTCVELSDHG